MGRGAGQRCRWKCSWAIEWGAAQTSGHDLIDATAPRMPPS